MLSPVIFTFFVSTKVSSILCSRTSSQFCSKKTRQRMKCLCCTQKWKKTFHTEKSRSSLSVHVVDKILMISPCWSTTIWLLTMLTKTIALKRSKCTFAIVNRQLPSAVGFVELSDSRVWQTNVSDGIYFNDFIKANLAEDILKRNFVNGMTGSSWDLIVFALLSIATKLGILAISK